MFCCITCREFINGLKWQSQWWEEHQNQNIQEAKNMMQLTNKINKIILKNDWKTFALVKWWILKYRFPFLEKGRFQICRSHKYGISFKKQIDFSKMKNNKQSDMGQNQNIYRVEINQ